MCRTYVCLCGRLGVCAWGGPVLCIACGGTGDAWQQAARAVVTQDELSALVAVQQYDVAFLRALESNDMRLLLGLCQPLDPSAVLSPDSDACVFSLCSARPPFPFRSRTRADLPPWDYGSHVCSVYV